MKVFSGVKMWGMAAMAAVLALGLAACGGGSSGGSQKEVAATVGGEPLGEQAVTDYIQNFRTSTDLLDDEAWGQWMALNGYTPETVRDEAIEVLATNQLVEQAAKEMGVEVSDEELNDALEAVKAGYPSTELWNEVLEGLSMTEDEYKAARVRPSLLQQKVAVALAGDAAVDDGKVLAYIQENASRFNGAKQSSHIMFDLDDEATARQVLAEITAGTLDFADAARQYSVDVSSTAGGYMGWDVVGGFGSDYQNALDGLTKGQVSDVVVTPYGIHIIQCTDVLEAPAEGFTSLDQLPEDLVDEARSLADDGSAGQIYYAWFADYCIDKVQVNPMPSGLPYDVPLPDLTASES